MKGRYNMKGFAAKIDHNLGRQRGGVRGLTKMINTDLLSTKKELNRMWMIKYKEKQRINDRIINSLNWKNRIFN